MRKVLEYVGIVALFVIVPPGLLYLFIGFCLWTLSFSPHAFELWRAISVAWMIFVFMYLAVIILNDN